MKIEIKEGDDNAKLEAEFGKENDAEYFRMYISGKTKADIYRILTNFLKGFNIANTD